MVVIDSSVLIPLAKAGSMDLVRKSFEEVITTEDVYVEVVEEGKGKKGTSKLKEAFESWISKKKVDTEKVEEIAELEGIAPADASLLILAENTSSNLLTNDRALILVAKSRDIEYYWLTTLLLKATKEGKLEKSESKELLEELVNVGVHLKPQVYSKVLKKIEHIGVKRN